MLGLAACSGDASSDADAGTAGSVDPATGELLPPLSVTFIDAADGVSRMLRWTEGRRRFEVLRPSLPEGSRGLVLSSINGSLYWPSRDEDVLLRGSLDGDDVERLPLAGLDSAYAVIETQSGADLYLSDYGRDEILRVDLEGRTSTVLVSGLVAPRALALDAAGGRLYWVDRGAGTVQSSWLDGGDVRTLIAEGLPAPYGVAWDAQTRRLLVADAELGAIFRVDPSLETPTLEPFLPNAGTHPSFLAIDGPARMLYWTDNRDNVLRRAPLDGGEIETLVEGLAGPRGLVLHRD